jgi:alpha-amylase/alpha-mannosidase (GH57 family)
VQDLDGDGDRVLTIALDGENAWGAYRADGRPFLHALYGLLEHDAQIETTTFVEYLDGQPARGIEAHPLFGFRCTHCSCDGRGPCCVDDEQTVRITDGVSIEANASHRPPANTERERKEADDEASTRQQATRKEASGQAIRHGRPRRVVAA